MATTLLIDIDGTCQVKGLPVAGAAQALATLASYGCRVRLFTNVDSMSGEMIREKLVSQGFDLAAGQVYSAVDACVAYLHSQQIRSVFCLVANRLRPLFEPWLTADAQPEAVIVGDPRDCCSYESLNTAFRYVLAGAKLIATQKGKYFLSSDGAQLDTGGFVSLLEYSSSREAVVMGKPSKFFFAGALGNDGSSADRVIVVGDDRETDILGANAMGWESVLVHTGKYALHAAESSGAMCTWEAQSIAELPLLIGQIKGWEGV